MKRPQEKEYFKGYITSEDNAMGKGEAYARALNEYIDNLETKVNTLNIESVDSRRELLIDFGEKIQSNGRNMSFHPNEWADLYIKGNL